MGKYTCYVHFNNPVCSFGYFICMAQPQYKCTSIDAYDDVKEWEKQAIARANYCNYRGLELTQKQAETRELPVDKADKCKYLMR